MCEDNPRPFVSFTEMSDWMEAHAMRAFAVAFFALTLVALVGGHFDGGKAVSVGTYGTMAVAYAALLVAALWRMENKATTFARHMLIAVVEEAKKRREQGEQT